MWLKYPTFPAALDSCLFAARCHFKLNNYPVAITLLQQIFSLRDVPAYATLKRRAMALAADCWSKIEPYPFDEVIANFEPVSARLTKRDQRIADWQRIQLELARAWRMKAVALEEEGGDPGRIRNLNREAAKLMKTVARLPGEQRDIARRLLAEWDLRIEAEPESDTPPITTFADARQRSAELMPQLEALHSDVIEYTRQLAQSSDEERDSIQQQLTEAQSLLKTDAQKALGVLSRALQLAGPDTTREDINQIRYSQCVCHYMLQRYFEASLIGEFLVDRYANIPFSRQAGGIAVRSCAVLHDRAQPEDRDFERERLINLAGKIVERWPGSSESATAADKLTRLIFSRQEFTDSDVAEVVSYIEQVPGDSIERAALEVKLGNKLWFAYSHAKKSKNVAEEQLAKRLDTAIMYLSRGIARFQSANLNMDAALGSLFLTNARLEQGDVKAAIEQLEASALAPVDLVKQKNPTVMQSELAPVFISETWKTAGKVYLAALRENPSETQWMDKAIGIVTAMQALADESGDDASRQNVVNMYRLIASQMQNQFEAIEDPQQQRRFAENLTRFLDTIQSRSDDPNTIIWAGRALMDLADTFAAQQAENDSKRLYELAVTALDRASKMGIKDPALARELKRQRAVAKRGQGSFQSAFDDLLELLRESPGSWQIQIDAARTLQMWGVDKRETEQLARALNGTERYRDPDTKRQKNLVWGWSQLVRILKSDDRFHDPYYQCLHAAIETRLEYGLIDSNQKVVSAALKQLNLSKTKDQDLGGPNWKPKFEKLEQRILNNSEQTP